MKRRLRYIRKDILSSNQSLINNLEQMGFSEKQKNKILDLSHLLAFDKELSPYIRYLLPFLNVKEHKELFFSNVQRILKIYKEETKISFFSLHYLLIKKYALFSSFSDLFFLTNIENKNILDFVYSTFLQYVKSKKPSKENILFLFDLIKVFSSDQDIGQYEQICNVFFRFFKVSDFSLNYLDKYFINIYLNVKRHVEPKHQKDTFIYLNETLKTFENLKDTDFKSHLLRLLKDISDFINDNSLKGAFLTFSFFLKDEKQLEYKSILFDTLMHLHKGDKRLFDFYVLSDTFSKDLSKEQEFLEKIIKFKDERLIYFLKAFNHEPIVPTKIFELENISKPEKLPLFIFYCHEKNSFTNLITFLIEYSPNAKDRKLLLNYILKYSKFPDVFLNLLAKYSSYLKLQEISQFYIHKRRIILESKTKPKSLLDLYILVMFNESFFDFDESIFDKKYIKLSKEFDRRFEAIHDKINFDFFERNTFRSKDEIFNMIKKAVYD